MWVHLLMYAVHAMCLVYADDMMYIYCVLVVLVYTGSRLENTGVEVSWRKHANLN